MPYVARGRNIFVNTTLILEDLLWQKEKNILKVVNCTI